jgi:hypothetical protein
MGNQDKSQGQMGQPQTGQTGQTGQTQMGQRDPDWEKDQRQGQGQRQGQSQGQGQTQHDWQGQGTDDMEQGKATDPAQPSGTTPLERDQRPINQSR